jgi:lipoate-protein ligase A
MTSQPRSGDKRPDCRLIITPPASGAFNMSVDEALLEQAAANGQWSLRFYAWQEPTLSLGYFQSWQERNRHPASLPCGCVRRASGGGAILHDQELTYSIAVPPEHRLARSAEELYRVVHSSLIELLSTEFGVVASLAEKSRASRSEEAFLCFQRRAGGDVIVGDVKVAGSAQRRWKGAVLQHGSILLRRSAWAEELSGLQRFTSAPMEWELLACKWQHSLATSLGVGLAKSQLSPEDLRLAALIAESRYSQVAWTRRR